MEFCNLPLNLIKEIFSHVIDIKDIFYCGLLNKRYSKMMEENNFHKRILITVEPQDIEFYLNMNAFMRFLRKFKNLEEILFENKEIKDNCVLFCNCKQDVTLSTKFLLLGHFCTLSDLYFIKLMAKSINNFYQINVNGNFLLHMTARGIKSKKKKKNYFHLK